VTEQGPAGVFRVRLAPHEFGRVGGPACLGSDLAAAMQHVAALHPHAAWWIASVEAASADWTAPYSAATPIALGLVAGAIPRIERTPRFEWAALAAVPSGTDTLTIPGGLLYADAPEAFPLGNAIAYVRAFDGSFVEIITADVELIRRFARDYGAGCIARAQY
jgi:hypothetical protein